MMFRGIELLLLVVGFCSVPGPLQSVQRAELWECHPCFAGLLWCALGC